MFQIGIEYKKGESRVRVSVMTIYYLETEVY